MAKNGRTLEPVLGEDGVIRDVPVGTPPFRFPGSINREDRAKREQANREAELRALDRLLADNTPEPTKALALAGIESGRFRLDRMLAERQAIDDEETEDRAKHDAVLREESEAATAAIVGGADLDLTASTKAQAGFESRQRLRDQRRAALDAAGPVLRGAIWRELAKQIRTLRAEIRTRKEKIIVQQAKLVRALVVLFEEEVKLERDALGEIGRVRKVLPDLTLPPAVREEGGESQQVTDERGNTLSLSVVTRPKTITHLDTPDLKTVRSFLEDHYIGIPTLQTSRRAAVLRRLGEIPTAMKDEGYDV